MYASFQSQYKCLKVSKQQLQIDGFFKSLEDRASRGNYKMKNLYLILHIFVWDPFLNTKHPSLALLILSLLLLKLFWKKWESIKSLIICIGSIKANVSLPNLSLLSSKNLVYNTFAWYCILYRGHNFIAKNKRSIKSKMYALKVNQGSSAYLLCENTCVLSVWSKVMSFHGKISNESLCNT